MLDRDEIDRALVRFQDAEDRIRGSMRELREHPGYQLLDGTALTGVTERRWAGVTAALAELRVDLLAFQRVLNEAWEVRGRRLRPGRGELAELTRLLTGPAAELCGEAGSRREATGPRRRTDHCTLEGLKARMEACHARGEALAAEAATAWSALSGRLVDVEESWRAAEEIAGELGERGDLDRLGAELDDVRATVANDPLSLWRGGRVDAPRLDRLTESLGCARSDLVDATLSRVIDRLRAHAAAAPDVIVECADPHAGHFRKVGECT